MNVLVLGAARSGKSAFAERLVMESGREAVYVATATAGDAEMAARIAAHRTRRGDGWTTVEAPDDLPAALAREARGGRAVLVDCLTLWLAGLIEAGRDLEAETGGLLDALARASAPVVMVSNEVGAGIVPDNALARRFADEQGRLNRRVADAVHHVVLVVAGRPIVLKPAPEPEIAL